MAAPSWPEAKSTLTGSQQDPRKQPEHGQHHMLVDQRPLSQSDWPAVSTNLSPSNLHHHVPTFQVVVIERALDNWLTNTKLPYLD